MGNKYSLSFHQRISQLCTKKKKKKIMEKMGKTGWWCLKGSWRGIKPASSNCSRGSPGARSGQAGTQGQGERGHRAVSRQAPAPEAASAHEQPEPGKNAQNPACPKANFPLEATSCPPARCGDFAAGLDAPLISSNVINYPAASSPEQICESSANERLQLLIAGVSPLLIRSRLRE